MAKRSKMDFCAEILEACKKTAKTTDIYHATKANFSQLEVALGELVDSKLVSVDVMLHRSKINCHALTQKPRMYKKKLYTTTELGRKFLVVYGWLQAVYEGKTPPFPFAVVEKALEA